MKGTMTKMEAIHALCEMKIDLEKQMADQLEGMKELNEKPADDIDKIQRMRWLKENELESLRYIRALEMAGTAMTR